jgi:hypothetical protein
MTGGAHVGLPLVVAFAADRSSEASMTKREPKIPDPPEGLRIATPNEWLPVWDRVITTTPTKAVGYACATRFAGWQDGAEIRPGNLILASICCCSTKSVERAFAALRGWGLMWRYHKGCREGDADIYRLTIPDNALSVIPLLQPDWSAPDTESGADSLSGADCVSGADSESFGPDSESGALPTQSPRTSVRDLSMTSVVAPVLQVTTSVEGNQLRPRPVDNHADDFEAHRQRQQNALTAWIRDHPETA